MNGRNRLTWEETAMNLAFNIAEYRSEDPFVQVGACIIKNDNQIVLGYNGSPKNTDFDWSDRTERRTWVFHAEANAVSQVLQGETKLLAVTHIPCADCLKLIKQKEINTVYYKIESQQYNPEFVKQLAIKFNIQLIQLK
jgi:deoxycytidylate deaminase